MCIELKWYREVSYLISDMKLQTNSEWSASSRVSCESDIHKKQSFKNVDVFFQKYPRWLKMMCSVIRGLMFLRGDNVHSRKCTCLVKVLLCFKNMYPGI